MFFNNLGKELSAKIKSQGWQILSGLNNIHANAVTNTRNEVDYFRHYFRDFKPYINGLRIPGATLTCKAEEIHGRPIVTLSGGQRCELGDYMVVIKYKQGATVIGRKIVICQYKRSHNNTWSINQTQLTLLRDWPVFQFGRVATGINSFSLNPTRPEFGSYQLINDLNRGRISNLYGNAYEVSARQRGTHVHTADAANFFYDVQVAFSLLLAWEIGEPIIPSSDIENFVSALYRYIGWEEDPPDEFNDFSTQNSEGGFWAIEITVSLGG